MADDGSKEQNTWPMPLFCFEVDFGSAVQGVPFQEVSGMETEVQVIEYRKSNSALFATGKMPGITKYGNITMKRGLFVNDNIFWDWMTEISMNKIKRGTVVIKLLDEAGKVTMQWQLNNAWPTKISSTELKADGNEVAIESLEIAYEHMIIANV